MTFYGEFRVFAFLVFVTSCVQLGNAAICPTTSEISQATTRVMKKCNSNIKQYYAENDGGNLASTYCGGMKILMNCAKTCTETFEESFHCTSEMLQEWLFVTLQYVVIGKKLGICHYDTQRLRNLVNDSGFENDPSFQGKSIVFVTLPDVQTKECAKRIHLRCAQNLVQEKNLCNGVSKFVTCYDEFVSGFPYNGQCGEQAPEISRKFNTLINEFSTDLIGKYQNTLNQAEMCHVDANEVDLQRYSHN